MNPETVERISPDVWLNSHLSIARFYGGCTIKGHRYVVDAITNELVRQDVLKREAKQRRIDRKTKQP